MFQFSNFHDVAPHEFLNEIERRGVAQNSHHATPLKNTLPSSYSEEIRKRGIPIEVHETRRT